MSEKTLEDRSQELKLTCQERGLFSTLYDFLHPQEQDADSDDDDTNAVHESVTKCIPKVLIASAETKLGEAQDEPPDIEISIEISEVQRALRFAKEIIENAEATPEPVKVAEQINPIVKGMLFLMEGILTTDWTSTEKGTLIGVRSEKVREALIAHLKSLEYTVVEKV